MTSWATDYLLKEYSDYPVIKRNKGGTFFQKNKNEVLAIFTAHAHNYLNSAGEWKPITLQPDKRGHIEGVRFGYNPAMEITYKGKPLFQFKSVTIDGKKYPLKFLAHENMLLADLPFGQAKIVFNENGVQQLLDIPEQMHGLLSFDERVNPNSYGLIKGQRMTLDGLPLGDIVNLSEMKYPLVIDPDYSNENIGCYIFGQNATYSTARSTSSNFQDSFIFPSTYNAPAIGQVTGFNISRTFIKFSTNGIWGGVSNAKINLSVTLDQSTADFDVQIVEQDWSAQDPITAGNRETAYDGCLSPASFILWRNTSGLSIDTYYASSDLTNSYVKKNSATYYSLRSAEDRNNSAPASNERIYLHVNPAGINQPPYLSLIFTPKIATAMPVITT